MSSSCSTRKYYTEDEVNNATKNDIPDISILHHNIRSIKKNFSELMGLLLNIDIDFYIIALIEIGQVNCENVVILLRETHKFEGDKTTQNFEGAGIFVKNHLIMNGRPKIKTGNDNIKVENVWYEITNPITHDMFIVAVIYRYPMYTKSAYDVFSKELEKLFDIVSKENIKCIIYGDININWFKIETDVNVNSFLI